MEEDEDKSQKIQMVAFTTNEKSQLPNDIISHYLNHNSHFIIKRSKQLIAFSSVLPEQKKPTKIMICTIIDLSLEYEGINEVNCYIIVIDLQKESSREKYIEILAYIQKHCDLSKKIYLLGIKKEDEDNKVKMSEEEIDEKIKELNLEYEYFELNTDNSMEISDKIIEIFQYSFETNLNDDEKRHGNVDGRSCSIY